MAAQWGEDRVADALGALLRQGEAPLAERIEPGLHEPVPPRPAELAAFVPDLGCYDSLIAEVAS